MRLATVQYIILILILLLAFALRMWDIGARSLWLDEGMEYGVAASPTSTLLQNVQLGIQDPPLYSILLHFWMTFGESEVYLRFLSTCFSLLSVLGVALLGYRLYGPLTALLGAVIMALLPAEICYAQEVGQYALMVCLLAWNLVALELVIRRRTWQAYGFWIFSALACTFGYYGTVFTLLVPLAFTMANDIFSRNRRIWQDSAALLAYGAGILPLNFFFSQQLFRGPTSQAFQVRLMSPAQELQTLWRATRRLISFQLTGWPWTNIPDWLPTSLLISALVLALVHRRGQIRKTRLLEWLLLTWGAYYVASKFGLYPFGFRYSLILTPLLALTIARGIAGGLARTWMRPISSALLLILLCMCILALPNHTFRERVYSDEGWTWPATENLRPVTQFWMEQRQDVEPTYIYYGAVPAFRYYAHIYGQENNVYYGVWNRHLAPAEKVASVYDTLGYKPQRLWFVFAHVHLEEDQEILAQLLKSYEIILDYEATGAVVYLLEQR